ncbi:MAG TPA: rhodanese-like domain-containing protein, partial [Luteolibacter sp.]
SRLVPLGTLPEVIPTLPRDQEILVHCKMGGRSAKAVRALLDAGFQDVTNVEGGIDAWLQLP